MNNGTKMINEKELEKWFELQKRFNSAVNLHLRFIDREIKKLKNIKRDEND